MKERLKLVRKKLGFTQQEFADKLGVKRGAIANYEIGRNVPIDAVLSLICREFNVNKKWLQTGEGEMFSEPSNSVLDALAVEYNLRPKDCVLVEKLIRMSEKERDGIFQFMRTIVDAVDLVDSSPIDYESEARAEAEAYYQEILQEKKAAAESSVSTAQKLA